MKEAKALNEKLQGELRANSVVKAEMEVKLEAKDAKLQEMQAKLEAKDAKLEEMLAKLESQPAVSAEQLKVLQLRVGKLHTDELLPDDVVFWTEDLIADYIELESSMSKLTRDMAPANRVVASMCQLVALSERMELDEALARQLQRKFA